MHSINRNRQRKPCKRTGEVRAWYCLECKEAIEKAIAENFDGATLPRDTAKGVIEQYGKERVEYVLANTITHLSHDGRFSVNNKEWAKSIVPSAEWNTRDLIVTSHPAVLDGFTNQARRYQELDRSRKNSLYRRGRNRNHF